MFGNFKYLFLFLRNFQYCANCYIFIRVGLFLREYAIFMRFLSMSRPGKDTRRADLHTYATDVQNFLKHTLCSLFFIIAALDISDLGPSVFNHLNHITVEDGIFVFQKHLNNRMISFLFSKWWTLMRYFCLESKKSIGAKSGEKMDEVSIQSHSCVLLLSKLSSVNVCVVQDQEHTCPQIPSSFSFDCCFHLAYL